MLDKKAQIAPHIFASCSATGDGEVNKQSVRGDFAMALEATVCGRLVFASGAADVKIETNSNVSELCSAHFEENIPSVRVQDGVVTIQYRRSLLFDGLAQIGQPVATVRLNPTVPWEIEFRDGVSRLTANLRQLQLHALDMGSVNRAVLTLPVPTMPANIYLSGSASDLTLHRPPGVALRLEIAGAASHLSLDGQRFEGTDGRMHWQSQDYNKSANRFDVRIAGSVSNLHLDMIL